MTYEEKDEILKEFRDNIGKILPEIFGATECDTEERAAMSLTITEVFDPVVNLYTQELNKAINPATDLTTPVIIMLLRQIIDGLTKQNPAAVEIADILNELFPSKLLSVSQAHAVRGNE